MQVRVVIVDDHPHARAAIRHILIDDARFEIVGEARSGEEAVNQMGNWQPDLVLMDLRLPEMNGLQTIKHMKKIMPNLKVIVISVSDDAKDLYGALMAGAQGYLIKNIAVDSWLTYISAVYFEDEDLPEQFTRKLVQSFQAQIENEATERKIEVQISKLTEREREVVIQLSKGLTNREIAETLVVSEHTIKNHLKNVMQKLHVTNRVQLVSIGMHLTRMGH